MFTGILEEVGRIEALQQRIAGARIRSAASRVLVSYPGRGARIAVNGLLPSLLSIFTRIPSPRTLDAP